MEVSMNELLSFKELLSNFKDDSQKFECPSCHIVLTICDFDFHQCPTCNDVFCYCNYCEKTTKLEGEIRP